MKVVIGLMICCSFSVYAATDYQRVASITTMLSMILAINLSFFFVLLLLSGVINKKKGAALIAASRESRLDPLTNLFNRRGFEHAVKAYNSVSGYLLVIDVDDFKKINDTYGHDSGDDALQEIATRLSSKLRDVAVFARFGGEEFVAFIFDANADDAVQLGNRLLQNISGLTFHLPIHKKDISITISIGAVPVSDLSSKFEPAFNLADKCLYSAKEQGKNQMVIADKTI